MAIPKWLNDILVAESVPAWAPKPSMDDIVRRVGVRGPQMSAEDYLRMLARDTEAARNASARSVDAGMSTEENVFGLPVKTIEQGRSLGERNLPGIENLSPEDQIALATALDKGAMLRAMPAVGGEASVRSRGPSEGLQSFRVMPADRLRALTGADHPASFIASADPSTAMVMDTLQNKANFRRLSGASQSTSDLPNPPAFRRGPAGTLRMAEGPEALGPDIPELLRQIRDDQIDSRALTIQETNDAIQAAELDRSMRESADAVAAREAYARQYGGFPPDTVEGMNRGVNRQRMIEDGTMARLQKDNPIYDIGRPLPDGEQYLGSPLYPPSQKYAPGNYDTHADFWWETEGKPLVKAMATGHVLSYPLMYAGYQLMKPNERSTSTATEAVPPPDDAESWQAEREQAIADSQKAYEQEQTRAAMDALPDVPIDVNATQYRQGSMPSMPDVPVELPDMPLVSMPQDEVGLPDDPMEDMTFLEENVDGAPAMDELDAALLEAGLQPAATNRQDISSMDVDGRRVDSLYPPESLEYQMEQARRRRTGRKPYPALSY
jgi:hypothetical protein